MTPNHDSRRYPTPLLFTLFFLALFLLHAPLLRLPYIWDEAGYYIPAARDLLTSGSLIPTSAPSNAHPPLVMAWIALWWKCVGYAPLVTRSAMLMLAAFSLLGLFRLAERVANTEVAIASTLCTALYPVFFAQSSLAQVDLAAAGLTFWALCAYLEHRPIATAAWFSLAVLAKETAILAPVALVCWELLLIVMPERFVLRDDKAYAGTAAAGSGAVPDPVEQRSTTVVRRILPLLFPLLPLILWYAYHYSRTGYVFGNPEFFRYNVAATLSPLRFLLALLGRLWQVFGYMHLWILTLGLLLAMRLPPVKDGEIERLRLAIPVQMIFLAIVVAYVMVMSVIGGAVLARYMLTSVPLVIIVAVSTLRRRLRHWTVAIAIVGCVFILSWFWNPPYGFSPEDNLAYRDFIVLHQDGDRFLEARYPMAHVLTAWPASDELRSPWLGYVTRPMQVVRIEDFTLDEVLSAADFRQKFEVALVFSTKYEPAHPLLEGWKAWEKLKTKFFGFHRDLPPAGIAQILGGHMVYVEERHGLWVAVIEMDRSEIQNAKN